MSEIVILAGVRTPIGAFQGGLATVPAPALGAAAIRAALDQAAVRPATVTDVLMGHVVQAGAGQAPARQAALLAGVDSSARTVTINKVCGSGMQAVLQASHQLHAGMGTVIVAGGMESMSQAPYLLRGARTGYRLGHQTAEDALIVDGLWDPRNDLHMGSCAEKCATKYQFTRAQQDDYAAASFRRATEAQQAGVFDQEITAVDVAGRRGRTATVAHDEGPARVDYAKIPTLRPAFETGGTITAANASTLNDGAAALALTTARTAAAHDWRPIARLVAVGTHAQDPVWFTTAPVQAAARAIQAAGWAVSDVDLWEVNEAFAVVPLAFMTELGIPHDRVNVLGGAIALGHPIGCSGARIIVTLITALRTRQLRRGVAAICIGGGEGLAVCVERLD